MKNTAWKLKFKETIYPGGYNSTGGHNQEI